MGSTRYCVFEFPVNCSDVPYTTDHLRTFHKEEFELLVKKTGDKLRYCLVRYPGQGSGVSVQFLISL